MQPSWRKDAMCTRCFDGRRRNPVDSHEWTSSWRIPGERSSDESREGGAEAARNQVVNVVNIFFRTKFESLPSIREYMREIQEEPGE